MWFVGISEDGFKNGCLPGVQLIPITVRNDQSLL